MAQFGLPEEEPDSGDDEFLHYVYSLKDFQAFTSSTYEGALASCTHTHTHTHAHTCTHTHTHAHTHAHTRTLTTYTCIHTHAHTTHSEST